MPVKINIDKAKVLAKIDFSGDPRKMEMMSEEILADCNEYCKFDTGNLIASSLIHSQLERGLLVWATPYAARQYYEIRTAYNGRTWRWAEVAKNNRLNRWVEQAKRLGGMRI